MYTYTVLPETQTDDKVTGKAKKHVPAISKFLSRQRSPGCTNSEK